MLEHEGEGVGLEQVGLGAGGAQVLVEEQRELGVGQWAKPSAHGDALGERVVERLGEALAQQRLASEHEGERTLLVEAVAGEQPEVLEGIIGHQVRIIDDDQRALGEAAAVRDEFVGRLALEPARP